MLHQSGADGPSPNLPILGKCGFPQGDCGHFGQQKRVGARLNVSQPSLAKTGGGVFYDQQRKWVPTPPESPSPRRRRLSSGGRCHSIFDEFESRSCAGETTNGVARVFFEPRRTVVHAMPPAPFSKEFGSNFACAPKTPANAPPWMSIAFDPLNKAWVSRRSPRAGTAQEDSAANRIYPIWTCRTESIIGHDGAHRSSGWLRDQSRRQTA